MKTKWVVDLYQQGKLDTPLAAAGVYKCLTPQLEAMVNRSSAYINKQLRRDFKKVHAEALQAKVLPYRTLGPDVEAIAAWQEQYSIAQFRYYCNSIKFIWSSRRMRMAFLTRRHTSLISCVPLTRMLEGRLLDQSVRCQDKTCAQDFSKPVPARATPRPRRQIRIECNVGLESSRLEQILRGRVWCICAFTHSSTRGDWWI